MRLITVADEDTKSYTVKIENGYPKMTPVHQKETSSEANDMRKTGLSGLTGYKQHTRNSAMRSASVNN